MAKKIYYSITQAAEFLGIHPETLRRWDRSKKLQAEIINERGDRRYELEKLKKFKDMVKLETDDNEEAEKIINKSLELLEDVAEKSKYEFEMGDHFRVPRDLSFYVLEDELRSNKFQALINLFSFVTKDGEFNSKMSGTDKNGKYWAFPSFDDFKKTDIKYIRSLLIKFKHPRIRSRIAHFIFLTDKDYQMGQIAVNEYLKVVDWLNIQIKKDPEASSGFEIVEALKSAYKIAKSLNYNLNDVNKLIANTILNFDNQNSSRWAATHRLIEFALKNKKEYGKDFWENAIKICGVMSKEQELKNNLFFARDFLTLGEKIEKDVFGLKNDNWRKKIASSFENEAKKHAESFVQSDFLVKAITEYKAMGNQDKVRELEMELQNAKKNMKFQTFSETVDLTDWVNQIRSRFKEFIQKENKEQILSRLTLDGSIIPKYETVKKQSEDLDSKYIFQSLCSTSIVDTFGNTPRKYETEAEKKYYSLIKQYYFSLIGYEASTKVLFEEIINDNKIDIESVEKFMSDHFWYGKEYEFRDPDTNKIVLKSKKWIDILHPGLKSYLNCLDLIRKGDTKEARDQLILAIDSLTPKIEGLIREFFETIGKPIDKIKTDRKSGKQTTEKKGLDDLLREPWAEEIFGNDLLILMKYLLIEVGGDNLRNNVSHALIFRENYQLVYAHWIFIIILRIGAYQISINPKPVDNTIINEENK